MQWIQIRNAAKNIYIAPIKDAVDYPFEKKNIYTFQELVSFLRPITLRLPPSTSSGAAAREADRDKSVSKNLVKLDRYSNVL